MHTNSQRGNILFLILLAIVLFVALSYAVMGQREQVATGMSAEQLDSKAAMIIQYTTLLEQTVNRLRLTGGCKDTELSFASPSFTMVYTNNNAPTDNHCHVFDPAGGGISVNTAVFDEISGSNTSNGSADSIISGSAVQYIGRDCADPSCSDLIAHLNLGSDANAVALCSRINQKLNNGNTPTWPGLNFDYNYRGDYQAGRIMGDPSYGATSLAGKSSGCYRDSNSTINNITGPHYSYYHVLLAR